MFYKKKGTIVNQSLHIIITLLYVSSFHMCL
jgi:hypothetical protein